MARSRVSFRFELGAMLIAAASCLAVPAGAEVVTLAPARDTTLIEDSAGEAAAGQAELLWAGGGVNWLGAGEARRGLLYFDVAAAIPSGSTITSVLVSLTADDYLNDSTSQSVELHRVSSDWGEGASSGQAAPGDATWVYTFYPTGMWNTPGGDFDVSILAAANVAGGGGYAWTSPQMRDDVQRWLDAPASNFGWLVRGDESAGSRSKAFYSREKPYYYRGQPSLSVTYVPPGSGPPPPSCVADAKTLCLDGGRFAVSATWRTDTGSGTASVHPLTDDTGYLWFFGASNVEAVVKVLDACAFNQRFWVFAGGLTDVNVVMTVTDTFTGLSRTYTNPQHTAFQPVEDTGAFATCDAAPPPSAAAVAHEGEALAAAVADEVQPLAATGNCVADTTSLCLNAGRFRVRARYDDGNGNAGDAHAVAVTADTGYFWFFGSSNVELVVKALDGCAANQRYWVYAGGLTDVNVVMTVTDTLTGATREYVNPPRTAFLPIQDSGAFDGCPSGDQPPHAEFTARCAALSCTVSTRATDDVGITHYLWDWGDGSPVLDAIAPYPSADQTHTYVSSGRFTITETVVDTSNQRDATERDVVPDRPPTAVNDAVTMYRDTTVVIDLLANDSDPDGDPLTFGSITPRNPGATYETVRLPTRDALRFTPPDSFLGTMEFSYVIDDGWGGEASATVTVTVNQAGGGVAP